MNQIKISSSKAYTAVLLAIFINCVSHAQIIPVDLKQSSVTWTGKKLTGEHTGALSFSKGELLFDKNELTGGSFEIDMNSIVCVDIQDKKSNTRLVDHLKSDDFFSVRTHPVSRLSITKVERDKDGYNIIADLTIKGITQPIAFPATIAMTNGVVKASARLTFDRSKFNVRFGSNSFFDNLGDEMIYDDIELEVRLVGQTQEIK